MNLARLHRRLAVLLGAAALLAYASALPRPGAPVGLTALALAIAWARPLPPTLSRPLDGVVLAAALGLLTYAALLLRAGMDFLPAMQTLVLLLLAHEALRPLEARNDLRLYGLSFAVLLAATAYTPGLLFAAAFAAYLVLGTLALLVGHVRRQAERHQVARLPLPRRDLVAAGALSTLLLLSSVIVFLFFPRLPQAWGGPVLRSRALTLAGFREEVSLSEHGARIEDNPAIVLRVEFPDGPPPDLGALLWRGRSYDHFDGVRWRRSRAVSPDAAGSPELYRWTWPGPPRRYTVVGTALGPRVLFVLHPVVALQPRTAIRPVAFPSGDLTYWGGDVPVYSATSLRPPSPVALRRAPREDRRWPEYLQLPPLDPAVPALARRLVAGAPSRYDTVAAVVRYLRSAFRYTRQLPDRPADATLEAFLFRRRAGHCEYFSTALAVLLRSVGVPARNVNGFLGGQWNPLGNYVVVTQNDAHSWVEIWFPGYGWVPFDATPSAAAAGEGGAGAAARVGPLRLWWDGLQFRWYRWVLQYNLDRQWAVFGALARALPRGPRVPAPPRLDRRGAALAAGAVALAALLLGARRLGRRRPTPRRATTDRARREASRAYRALHRLYERAGWRPPRTPGAMAAWLRAARPPGWAPALRLVRAYLPRRFGPEAPPPVVPWARQLRRVRRALRRGRPLFARGRASTFPPATGRAP